MRIGGRCLTASPATRAAHPIGFTTCRHLADFLGGAGSSRRSSGARAQSVLAGLCARTLQRGLHTLSAYLSDDIVGRSPSLGGRQPVGRHVAKRRLGRPEALPTAPLTARAAPPATRQIKPDNGHGGRGGLSRQHLGTLTINLDNVCVRTGARYEGLQIALKSGLARRLRGAYKCSKACLNTALTVRARDIDGSLPPMQACMVVRP